MLCFAKDVTIEYMSQDALNNEVGREDGAGVTWSEGPKNTIPKPQWIKISDEGSIDWIIYKSDHEISHVIWWEVPSKDRDKFMPL